MLAAWAPRGCRSERSFRCLQSFARQPSGIVECREIAKPAVAQDGCDALARPQLPRERHRAGDVDPRRQAEAQPLLVEQAADDIQPRSEEHTSELQSLMRISYAVFCLKKKKKKHITKSLQIQQPTKSYITSH